MKKCAVEKKCGACKFLQVSYEEQLANKKAYVERLFPRVNVEDVVGMEDPYHYRHKIYCAFGYDSFGKVKAGLFQENSHRIVFTDACLIQQSLANQLIHDLCKYANLLKIEPYEEDKEIGTLRYAYIRISHHTRRVLLTIVIGAKFLKNEKALIEMILNDHPEVETIILNFNHGHDSMVLGKREKVLYGKGYIMDEIDGLTFKISSRSFYQVNPIMTQKLYAKALELANLKESDLVLDVCCGIGTMSLLAARKAQYVLGVEINANAIKDAKENAKRNNIDNVDFIAMDATQFLKRLGEVPDVVILDPARSGLGQQGMEELGKLEPNRIVYVSCNPNTQQSDIEVLKAFGYTIDTMVPFDQFPMTPNVETVALLTKKAHRKKKHYGRKV